MTVKTYLTSTSCCFNAVVKCSEIVASSLKEKILIVEKRIHELCDIHCYEEASETAQGSFVAAAGSHWFRGNRNAENDELMASSPAGCWQSY
jgi:UDP-galactopyranose mutase